MIPIEDLEAVRHTPLSSEKKKLSFTLLVKTFLKNTTETLIFADVKELSGVALLLRITNVLVIYVTAMGLKFGKKNINHVNGYACCLRSIVTLLFLRTETLTTYL